MPYCHICQIEVAENVAACEPCSQRFPHLRLTGRPIQSLGDDLFEVARTSVTFGEMCGPLTLPLNGREGDVLVMRSGNPVWEHPGVSVTAANLDSSWTHPNTGSGMLDVSDSPPTLRPTSWTRILDDDDEPT